MEKEENSVNKSIHKIGLYLLKILPILLASCYLINTVFSYFLIDVPLLSTIGGTSIITLIYLYYSSYEFKFCAYHRVFLHYIVISDIINYYDLYIGIPILFRTLFSINCIIAGVCLFTAIYLKFRHKKKDLYN